MEYRRLNLSELKQLETPFIAFLTSNGIPADEWEKIKKEKPNKMNQLIDEFSDKVFGNVISKVNYVQRRTAKTLELLHFGEDFVHFVGLKIKGESEGSFLNISSQADLVKELEKDNISVFQYKDKRPYTVSREKEIFNFLETGFLILPDAKLFNTISDISNTELE